jgi:membrane-associated phospholipid phosphatase
MLSLISFSFFLLLPVRAPKPAVSDAKGMYWLLQQYDVPLNSLPSLHAGMIVYTLAFGTRITGVEIGGGARALFLTWGALIMYATLATKEHYVLDIVSGVLLGLAVHVWIWRTARGFKQDAQQQRSNVPRGVEIVVGAADGIELSGEVEKVAQENPASIVRP